MNTPMAGRDTWIPARVDPWDAYVERDPVAWDVITAARRFHRLLQVHMDRALYEMGVSFAQYEVMELLQTHPKLHAGELGRRLRLTRQGVRHLLFMLDRADLVEVWPKSSGRRCVWLTDSGRKRVAHCRWAIGRAEKALNGLPPDDHRRLLELFATYERVLVPPKRYWWLE